MGDDKNKISLNKSLEALGHGKPVTRRELLGAGLISGSALVITPSLLGSIYSNTAQGQDAQLGCGDDGVSSNEVGTIIIELSGGGNIAGSNVFVGGRGGQKDKLPNYDTIGGSAVAPGEVQYGLTWNVNSKILQGINQFVTTPADRDKIKGILYCSASNDDTGNNAFLPSHAIIQAGSMGKLAKLVGTNAGSSGGRSKAAFNQAGLSSVSITQASDATAIIKKHAIASRLGDESMNKIMRTASDMGYDSLCQLSRRSLSEQFAAVCGCRYGKSYQIATGFNADSIDPTKDANISTVFAQAASGAEAGVTKVVVDGFAGVGVLVKGGYDYHNNTRTTGDQKDLEAGQTIGKILAYAIRKGKPVCIVVVTDGGVAGNASGVWTSDSGVRSAALQLAYHPKGVKTVSGKDPQIGAYKTDGTVDRDFNAISNNPSNLALGFTLNWLALKGDEKRFSTLFPENELVRKIEDYLLFQKSV